MPRYFFHVAGIKDDVDVEGTVLLHAEEARWQAVIYASELMSINARNVRLGDVWRIVVNGDDGAPLFSVDCNVTDTSGEEVGVATT